MTTFTALSADTLQSSMGIMWIIYTTAISIIPMKIMWMSTASRCQTQTPTGVTPAINARDMMPLTYMVQGVDMSKSPMETTLIIWSMVTYTTPMEITVTTMVRWSSFNPKV